MRERSGPTIEHREVAARLGRLREAAGLSPAEAATQALGGRHAITVRRLESAAVALDAPKVEALLRAYGVGDAERESIMAEVEAAARPGWWHSYRHVMPAAMQEWIGLESAADLIWTYRGGLVPDLMQTRAYADALRRIQHPAEEDGERAAAVELLMRRQELAVNRGTAVWALMPETAAHTRVGGEEVMAEQHAALRALADRPRWTVQVLPTGCAWHPLVDAPLVRLLRMRSREIGDHVVLSRLGDDAELVDDPDTVARWRTALDLGAATAQRPGTVPNSMTTGEDHARI